MSDNWKMNKIGRVIVLAITLFSTGVAIYIMTHQIGLQNELDFGAGAYYYADIPNFENFVKDKNSVQTEIPMWIYIALFLAWGFLMYKLWGWIDSKKK